MRGSRRARRSRPSLVPPSNGWAEFTLKNPPPLVPSCLMAIWLATGPPGICWVEPATVWAVVKPWVFWMTPHASSTIATTNDERQQDAQRRAHRSTQKLPIVRWPARDRPADQRDHHRHARGGGHEVLDREPHHLGEVAQRVLAAVGLPVRVGHEADRGVERQRRRDVHHVGRVERQAVLDALDQEYSSRTPTTLNASTDSV